VWDELSEEVHLEMTQLAQSLGQLSSLLNKVQTYSPDVVEKAALAGFLHSFYTGMEAVLDRISRRVDGGRIRTTTWHKDLLERMSMPTESRPKVISDDLRDVLRGYLSFRHVFRNAYPFELQWTKMAPLVAQCESTFEMFQEEIQSFLSDASGTGG